MTKEIQLSKGKVSIVDDEDYAMLMGLGVRWCANDGYAFNRAFGRLHRFLINAPREHMVDHINGDKLDNRRENLRLASSSQNQANRKNVRGLSPFKGVTWQRRTGGGDRGYWKAQLVVDGKVIYLGSHRTDLECAKAYNKAALEHFGEYASLNDLTLPASNLISSERRQVNKDSPSGFKGVSFDSSRGKWVAQLARKGIKHLCKRFSTAEEAAKAYDVTAREVYGPTAVTNF